MLALAALTIGLLGSCSRIDNLEKRVDTLENDKIASVQEQINGINASIKKLDQIDGLSKRADELEAFVKNDLASKEWVDATFATLEQYQITCDTVANLKEKLGQTDEKIDECVESLKDWINSEFNDYYKIAEVDAKLKALKDTTLAEEIARTKEELTEGYKTAIKTAIEDNDGFVTPEIKNALGTLNGQIAAISNKADALGGEISLLKEMVQSIEFVPERLGGMAEVEYFGSIDTTRSFCDLVMRYRIKPAAALDSIFSAAAGTDSLFSLRYKGVRLADTKASGEEPCLTVKSVTRDAEDGELITVIVDRQELNKLPVRNCISDHTTLSIALEVNYRNSNLISSYTNVDFRAWYENLEEGIVNVYKQMARLIGSRQQGEDYNPYRVLFNICGDDVVAAGKGHDEIAELNEFRYDATNKVIYYCYTNFYKAIDACNQFICKYSDPDDNRIYNEDELAEPALVRKYLAEARVLRAWLHFTLATGWGNPPIVDRWPAPAEPANSDSKEEVFKWCLKELTDEGNIVAQLEERKNPDDREGAYYVTKGFAHALTGKVALFLEVYDTALENFKKVIDNKKYELVPTSNISDNFHTVGNGNKEKVFELDMERYAGYGYWDLDQLSYMGLETDLLNWYSDGFVADPMARYSPIKGKGSIGVPKDFGNKLIQNDGLEAQRRKMYIQTMDEAIYWSAYYESSEINAMPPVERAESDKVGIKDAGLYGQSLFLPLKPMSATGDFSMGTGNRNTNFTIMRYPEVLLLYAEASAQANREKDPALMQLNAVQNRAGSKTISSEVSLDAVKREKQFELWMEGCRWVDIVRWNDEEALKRLEESGKTITVLYDRLTRTPKEAETSAISWENGSEGNSRFYTVDYPNPKADLYGFKKGKHELFPFPAAVLSANENLKQNPGWEE